MKIVTITHPSYTLKTMFLQEIKKYYEMNYDIEIICSAISKNFIDGIIIREINLAIIANDLITSDLHIHKEISLENTFKIEQNFNEKKETIKAYIQTCFRELRKGLKIDDDLESIRSEEHTSELQSRGHLVCRLLLEKKNRKLKAKIDDI